MKNVIITADSPCDLPKDIVEKRDIKIIPLSILLGASSYKDGMDINPGDIYKYCSENKDMPKTAAVPPSDYYDVFSKYTSEGCEVVHIGLSSGISSSFSNAKMVAEEFSGVYCIDSKSLCMGMGLLVLKACDFRDKKWDAKKIAKNVEALVPKVRTTFVINSMEYLYKGGRCSALTKFGANVLGIKPSIAVNSEGKLDVAKKYRGKSELVYRQYIDDCLENASKIDKSRIVFANSGQILPSVSSYARGVFEAKGKWGEIIEADAGCVISSHCGPKTVAVFYILK